MNACICRHHALLRHIYRGDLYWYCPQCHQAMPSVEIPRAEIDVPGHLFRKQKRALLQTLQPVIL